MDAQIGEAEKISNVLVSLIEPIYKQHGIPLSVLEDLKSNSKSDGMYVCMYVCAVYVCTQLI